VGRVGASVRSKLCFSALDASVAREAELELARAGKLVISNASSWRMDPRVPLIVPEVNAGHLALLDAQTDHPGGIVTNPNCSTIGLVLALRPLLDAFGLARVQVVTLQAISGAGAPTPATLRLLGNVVPYIPGEEEKLESETAKILGELEGLRESGNLAVVPAELEVEAQCNRVPVLDGHTLCVRVELEEDAARADLLAAWREFSGPPQELELPSAPDPPIRVHEAPDAPQPRLHAEEAGGMRIHVGRLRERSPLEWQFTTLSHNTLRGAAGGALLVGELALATGWMRSYALPPN
jgi:aspartate-semialdehyde dehydrogenase